VVGELYGNAMQHNGILKNEFSGEALLGKRNIVKN